MELKRACREAGVPVFSPHRMRNAFIDYAQAAGIDVATTCAYTGHTPQVMFEYYRRATMTDQQRAMARAGLGSLEPPADENVVPIRGKGGGGG